MWKKLIALTCLLAAPAMAQDKAFTLQAPDALVETGLLKHLLPRFSLKKGIRITVSPEEGDASLGTEGTPVFRQDNTIWHLSKQDGSYTDAFQEWLLSDVGKRTIEAFKPDGTALFSADVAVQEDVVEVAITGDVVTGERVSLTQCGRCHVVNEKNKFNAIGSTPSFRLMRNFGDWRERFEVFYVLKPHGSFTQIEDVTPPFEPHLPPPIAPLELTLDDLDAIIAYVSTLEPADLGAPIEAGGAFQSP